MLTVASQLLEPKLRLSSNSNLCLTVSTAVNKSNIHCQNLSLWLAFSLSRLCSAMSSNYLISTPALRHRRRRKDNIKMDLREIEWSGMDWIGTSGGLLWTRQWTFGFHTMLGNSWVAEQLAVSQEGFSCMELVTISISSLFGLTDRFLPINS
jgi:hypothetical protein